MEDIHTNGHSSCGKPLTISQQVNYEPGRTVVKDGADYEYDDLRPSFPDIHWGPLTELPYHDKGLNGHPQFRNLLDAASDVFDYIPKIGTEIHGVNLAQLTDAQKDDLARLTAIRGVVFFRNQTDLDINAQRELGRYFGVLHKHATTAVPCRPGLEDVHVVLTDRNSKDQRACYSTAELWHSDVCPPMIVDEQTANLGQVTYELQPPSYSILKLLSCPPRGGGGDTLWTSQYAVYDSLSSHMQKYLEGLTARHTAERQAKDSHAAGRPVRRDPVTTEHPIIRTNPVTGWKSVYFTPGFITDIVGVPKVESNAIINYLNEVISTTQELQVRFQWQKNDVAFWDNRVCVRHFDRAAQLQEAHCK